LATGAMLALSGIGSAQLSAPLPSAKEAAPAETTKPAAASDPAVRLAEIRQTIARLERPGAVGEGSPTGTPDAEIGDRMRLQHLQRRLRDSEAELRLATERLEGASADTEQRRRAKWLRDLAQLRSEEIAAALDEVQQGRTNAAEEKGAAQAGLRLTKAQLAIA